MILTYFKALLDTGLGFQDKGNLQMSAFIKEGKSHFKVKKTNF